MKSFRVSNQSNEYTGELKFVIIETEVIDGKSYQGEAGYDYDNLPQAESKCNFLNKLYN